VPSIASLLSLATRVLILSLCAAVGAGQGLAANKAFVVGNSNYADVDRLRNPVNDARDLADRLKALGYEVTLGLDLGRRDFLAKFQAFTLSLQPDDLSLVYFAGHGVQIGGENYLFPVDARVMKEADARTELVALNQLLADLSRATRVRIVVLDACRNNPYSEEIAKAQETRSLGVSRGLARVYAGVGSFIAFSTQPNNVALDGVGRNSPFADALLRHISTQGIDVHAVMRQVRNDVQRTTGEKQIPWESSSLIQEVNFAKNPGPPGADRAQPVVQPRVERAAEAYSYVTGLDPKGDNFLALRSAPGAEGVRIATMGPDTLVKVVEVRGVWRRVLLLDGSSGWAHGNWIACCRSMVLSRPSPTDGPAQGGSEAAGADSCDSIWLRRNSIWHRYGYCFATPRAVQTFGNAGCFRDLDGVRAAMSPADRTEVEALVNRERELGCR
jgi:uncharacterized caspase-like protein